MTRMASSSSSLSYLESIPKSKNQPRSSAGVVVRSKRRRTGRGRTTTLRLPPPPPFFFFRSSLCRFTAAAAAAAVLLFLGTAPHAARAEKDSNPYPWGENPNNRAFRMYWNDARNVLQDLDQFRALYVKYHGCVWSECSRGDNYDDDGENRDGDEYWYQYRTQPFCANAAFSLYGVLKNHWLTMPFHHCSRATYINSFFTYGGADTVLEALNVQVQTVFDEMDDYGGDDDDDGGYGGGGGYGKTHSNAVCYEVENENNYNNNNNRRFLLWEDEDQEEEEHQRRDLNSNDNNNNYDYSSNSGTSSTMGCSAKGAFVAALFGGQTCDGNYYLESTDELRRYNRKMSGVRCRQVWNRFAHGSGGAGTYDRRRRGRRQLEQQQRELEDNNNNNGNNNYYAANSYNSPAEYLLSHSWACDVSLYPSGCPDPYGLKSKYDAVLAAVAAGRSPGLAVWQVRLRAPLAVLSTACLLAAVALLGFSYYLHRRADAQQAAGAGAGGGWRLVLWKDAKFFATRTLPRALKELWRTVRRGCRAGLRHLPFEVRSKRKRSRRRRRNGGDAESSSRASGSRRGGGGGRRSKDGKEQRRGGSRGKRGSRRPEGEEVEHANDSPSSSSQRSSSRQRQQQQGRNADAADFGDDDGYSSSPGGTGGGYSSTNYSSYSEQDQF